MSSTVPIPLYQTRDGRWTFVPYLATAGRGPARIVLVPGGSRLVAGLLWLPDGERIPAAEAYDRGRTNRAGFGLGD